MPFDKGNLVYLKVMDTSKFEELLKFFIDKTETLLDDLEWHLEDWWHSSSYAPPSLWFNLQNLVDPMPVDDGKSGLNIVTFALTRLTTRQAYREAWFKYDQAKWRTNPKSVQRVIPKLKTDDAIRTYYLLYKLQLLIIENYKTLLGELELRRVYSEKELKKAKRDKVLRAHHQQTYDAYVERL